MARKYSRKNISRKSKRNNRKRSVRNMRGGIKPEIVEFKDEDTVTINKDKLKREYLIAKIEYELAVATKNALSKYESLFNEKIYLNDYKELGSKTLLKLIGLETIFDELKPIYKGLKNNSEVKVKVIVKVVPNQGPYSIYTNSDPQVEYKINKINLEKIKD